MLPQTPHPKTELKITRKSIISNSSARPNIKPKTPCILPLVFKDIIPRTIAGRHKNSNAEAAPVKDIAANPPQINDRLPNSGLSLFSIKWTFFLFSVFFSSTGNEANIGVIKFISNKKINIFFMF